MGFINMFEHDVNGASPARLCADRDAGHVDLLLPLDEPWTRDAVAFRTSSSTPFGTWWSGSAGG